MSITTKTNGSVSFWYADMGGLPAYRAALPKDETADVCIVGAGFTGLWTAYYLKKANPQLRIVVLEKEFAGFGASGRNGGWLSGGFEWSRERYMKNASRGEVIALQQAMAVTVDEVIAVCESEGIDADILRVDNLMVATNTAQLNRAKSEYDKLLAWDTPPEHMTWLNAEQMRERIAIDKVQGGFSRKGKARVQPAKLVRGLAEAVERLGVAIYEQTQVIAIDKGRVTSTRGTVQADAIIRATEGFTAGLAGHKRLWLPMNSALIATEPLPDALWQQIGWQGCELLGDMAHAYCYAQRTREGRIAMGGRGVPYRFGSATDTRGQTQQATIDKLHAILTKLLPQTAKLEIDHAWCGVLGVPRDWCTSVGFDPQSGIGWAGGYVGLGVSTSNLAGRTLCDLVLRRDTELARMPWVNRQVRKWEPEPLRWLGVHSMYQLYRLADKREQAGMVQQTSKLATLANRLTGR